MLRYKIEWKLVENIIVILAQITTRNRHEVSLKIDYSACESAAIHAKALAFASKH
jgi:hypothetical protein